MDKDNKPVSETEVLITKMRKNFLPSPMKKDYLKFFYRKTEIICLRL